MKITAFDYKKAYKDLYMPKGTPALVTVPPMNFIMADGKGDPNTSPMFNEVVSLLYGFAFTIKMSKNGKVQPEGYFDFVVPPLEGLWWTDGSEFSLDDRENWRWTLMLRQPEFVNSGVFDWAGQTIERKKPEQQIGLARFESFDEGLCVQAMHKGAYAKEPETMEKINVFIAQSGLVDTVEDSGLHHEIYLSDPRRGKPENMRTVLRRAVARRQTLC